mmetsp:Transcript_24545/g.85322  ORF Transcript_24545/g.85322 Transcript_24545/m.85322 type:complete len:177 (+) Transcript_24545:1869-2399(+)
MGILPPNLRDDEEHSRQYRMLFGERVLEAPERGPCFARFWSPHSRWIDAKSQSRYHADFTEVAMLGRGGFGEVVKVRNNLDGRMYAVKQITCRGVLDPRLLREVTTLSRLQDQHVVRYYQAWVESEYRGAGGGGSGDDGDSDGSGSGGSSGSGGGGTGGGGGSRRGTNGLEHKGYK